MIKTHETDPRCCGPKCPKMVKTDYTFLCHTTVEILDNFKAGRQGVKVLRTPACLRKYGV